MDPFDPQWVAEFRARAKSFGYPDEEIDKQIEKLRAEAGASLSGYSGLANVGRSALQGAAFNWADDVLEKLPEWLGGGKKAADEFRSREKTFSKAHPIAAGAANVAGGMLVPGGALAKGAVNIKRAAGLGALYGGASGALAGAGAAEGGLEERAAGAAAPAVAGGILGAAIPGSAAALRAAFSPAARANARLQGAVERSGGLGALTARLKAFERTGRGGEVMLGDLSRPLQQATDFAANNSDEAFEAIEGVALPRQADQSERLLGDVRQLAGDPQADKIADDLAKSRLSWADSPQGYQGLRDKNPVVIPAMGQRFHALLQRSGVTDAWKQAQEIGLIGPMPPSHSTSFEVLQGTKERMDAAVGQAFSRGARDLAVRLRSARDELVDLMREGVPGYEKVAKEYHDRLRLEEALQAGQGAYRSRDSRGLKDFVASLSDDERTKFREGLVSELITELRNAQTNVSVARRMTQMSPRTQDVIEEAFGDERTFRAFMQRAKIERELDAALKALGGSQTHRRGAALADPAAMAVDAATSGPGAAVSGAARSVLPHVLSRRTAREMGPQLATQGTDNIRRLLELWGKSPQEMLGPVMTTGVPVGGGLLGANLFDQQSDF